MFFYLFFKKKLQDAKKPIRITFSIGTVLISIACTYWFFFNGINQALILGSIGLVFAVHGAYMLSKYSDIDFCLMITSYDIAGAFLFAVWAVILYFNNEISGAVMFLIASSIGLVGAHCMKKYGSKWS